MTLIWAKQFNKKWALLTDDCVTIWQSQVSAAKQYRPKLREISWKNYDLIIASCWWTREVDLILNLLQAKLEINKVKDTIDLEYVIQTTLVEAWKTLKELANDPSVWLLILETKTNTLWHTDDYSMFQPQDGAEIVAWSWEQAFIKAAGYRNFCDAFKMAVETDEYCEYPIYAYRDWKMYRFSCFDSEHYMNDVLFWNTAENDWAEKTPVCCETTPSHERGDSWEVCGLWSWSWLSCKASTKLW